MVQHVTVAFGVVTPEQGPTENTKIAFGGGRPSTVIHLIRGRVAGAADPAGSPRLHSHPQHFPAHFGGYKYKTATLQV